MAAETVTQDDFNTSLAKMLKQYNVPTRGGTTYGSNTTSYPAVGKIQQLTPTINLTPGQFIPQQNWASNTLTDLKPLKPEDHLDNYKDREGFKWFDENQEWAIVPEIRLEDTFWYSMMNIYQPKGKPFVEEPTKKQHLLLHRHDDDRMISMLTLNSRYHGDHAFICKECHKPCPEEYRMLYVLQKSFPDKS